MLRPARSRLTVRALRIGLSLVFVLALIGVWRFTRSAPARRHAGTAEGNRPDQGTLDKNLLDSIRNGDSAEVRRLIQEGASASHNAKNEALAKGARKVAAMLMLRSTEAACAAMSSIFPKETAS